jgi:peptidoglycan/xylan/chitin deacetylase (PgdA/CDA1 family)
VAKYRKVTPWLIAAPAVAAGLASFVAYGAVSPQAQLFGTTLYSTSHPDAFALTFDDGPNPAITPKLLDLLDRYRVKATFFVVGKFVRESPTLVKEIVARGHLIGNHTDSHPNLFFCGPAETRAELRRCTEAIQQAVWFEPRWFRPPFGFRSPWLSDIVHQQGMHTVMWTLLPGDWRPKPADWLIARMQPISDRVSQKQQAAATAHHVCRGDILCLHDGDYARPNGDRARTLAALEFWLPRWRDLGLEFVTISQAAGKAVEG